MTETEAQPKQLDLVERLGLYAKLLRLPGMPGIGLTTAYGTMAEAAAALQQAIAERDKARSEYQLAHQRAADNLRLASAAQAQVQRLTASLAGETEACAKVAESRKSLYSTEHANGQLVCSEIASSIRSRPRP